MNTNLAPVALPRPLPPGLLCCPRSLRVRAARGLAPRGLRRLALGLVPVLASLAFAAPAAAGAPPGDREHEGDPLDLFLDRSRGDRATDDRRAGSFEIGVTGSLGLSSWASPSFGVLAFVLVPFDRLHEGRRRELTEVVFAGGPAKLPPADAGVPLTDRSTVRSSLGAPSPSPARPSADRGSPAASSPPASRSSPAAADHGSSAAPALPVARTATMGTTTGHGSKVSLDPAAPSPLDLADVEASEASDESGDTGSTLAEAAPSPAPLLTPELARGAAKAACKAAKIDEADARLDALASRAKTSALLPELRLRATRAIDETESLTPTEYDPSHRTASGSSTTWLEARATFRLDRLVFADDEIAVERQRMARAAERTRLVERVLDLLDAWQRARAAAVDPEALPEAAARATLAIAASEASLDVLTDGWFSKAIAVPLAPARDAPVAARRPSQGAPQDIARDTEGAPRAAPISPPPTSSPAFSKPPRSTIAAASDARVAEAAPPRDAPHPSTSRAGASPSRAEKASK